MRAARTPPTAVACPQCGQPSQRVHAYHRRRLTDLPVGGRGVVVDLRVRRLVCSTPACRQRTFREQVPALTQRWARRTRPLTALIGDLAVVVAGHTISTQRDAARDAGQCHHTAAGVGEPVGDRVEQPLFGPATRSSALLTRRLACTLNPARHSDGAAGSRPSIRDHRRTTACSSCTALREHSAPGRPGGARETVKRHLSTVITLVIDRIDHSRLSGS